MPVKKDASGHRSVQAEVEVPGTPEQVWQAIATGPGISSWFVPSEVEERVGGAVTSSLGPGMDSLSTITAWEPPHRFAANSGEDMGPDHPTIATEWIVEARSGGICVVRVVHSWFTSRDDWDDLRKTLSPSISLAQLGGTSRRWYGRPPARTDVRPSAAIGAGALDLVTHRVYDVYWNRSSNLGRRKPPGIGKCEPSCCWEPRKASFSRRVTHSERTGRSVDR